MMDTGFDPVIALGLRAALAFILVAAAVHKFRNMAEFKKTLSSHGLLAPPLIPGAAYGLGVLEIACAAGLLAVPWSFGPPMLAAGLFLLYGGVMAAALVRGKRDLDCGCGGLSRSQSVSWSLVLRNGVLMLIAVLLATPATLGGFLWIDWGTVIFIAAFGALLYAMGDTLLANHARMVEAMQ